MEKVKQAILKLKSFFKSDLDKEINDVAQEKAMLKLAEQYDIPVSQEDVDEVAQKSALLEARCVIDCFASTKNVRGFMFLATAAAAGGAIGSALYFTGAPTFGVAFGTFAAFVPGAAFAIKNFIEGTELRKQSQNLKTEAKSEFIQKHLHSKDDFYNATAHILDAKNEYLKNIENDIPVFAEINHSDTSSQSQVFEEYCSHVENIVYGIEEREL